MGWPRQARASVPDPAQGPKRGSVERRVAGPLCLPSGDAGGRVVPFPHQVGAGRAGRERALPHAN